MIIKKRTKISLTVAAVAAVASIPVFATSPLWWPSKINEEVWMHWEITLLKIHQIFLK